MAVTIDGTTGITLPTNGISLPDNAYTNVASIQSTTTNPTIINNSSGTEVGKFCRAWVNFFGTGTPGIRSAFNVTSITDNGVADYTINYSANVNVTDSSVVLYRPLNDALNNWGATSFTQITSANSTRVQGTRSNSGTLSDNSLNVLAVFY